MHNTIMGILAANLVEELCLQSGSKSVCRTSLSKLRLLGVRYNSGHVLLGHVWLTSLGTVVDSDG
jgi:hypothetical protein